MLNRKRGDLVSLKVTGTAKENVRRGLLPKINRQELSVQTANERLVSITQAMTSTLANRARDWMAKKAARYSKTAAGNIFLGYNANDRSMYVYEDMTRKDKDPEHYNRPVYLSNYYVRRGFAPSKKTYSQKKRSTRGRRRQTGLDSFERLRRWARSKKLDADSPLARFTAYVKNKKVESPDKPGKQVSLVRSANMRLRKQWGSNAFKYSARSLAYVMWRKVMREGSKLKYDYVAGWAASEKVYADRYIREQLSRTEMVTLLYGYEYADSSARKGFRFRSKVQTS